MDKLHEAELSKMIIGVELVLAQGEPKFTREVVEPLIARVRELEAQLKRKDACIAELREGFWEPTDCRYGTPKHDYATPDTIIAKYSAEDSK